MTWFVRALESGELSSEPFDLAPHRRIVNPERWYACLKADVEAGPAGPRAEVLPDDLRLLREVVEGG